MTNRQLMDLYDDERYDDDLYEQLYGAYIDDLRVLGDSNCVCCAMERIDTIWSPRQMAMVVTPDGKFEGLCKKHYAEIYLGEEGLKDLWNQ